MFFDIYVAPMDYFFFHSKNNQVIIMEFILLKHMLDSLLFGI